MNLRHTRCAAIALLLALAWSVGANAPAQAAASKSNPAEISIRDAWTRATPAGARMGAVYLTLESKAGDLLLGATVPHSVAGEAQIHETVVDSSGGGGPRMGMRRVASIELPAGQPVELKPGGFHIMLIDLKKQLKPGGRVTVTLTLAKAGRRAVTAPVREER
jgi:copper(I)-binding protein